MMLERDVAMASVVPDADSVTVAVTVWKTTEQPVEFLNARCQHVVTEEASCTQSWDNDTLFAKIKVLVTYPKASARTLVTIAQSAATTKTNLKRMIVLKTEGWVCNVFESGGRRR